MKECCANCRNRFDAHKTDFTKLKTDEPIDSILDGFICMAFAMSGLLYGWSVQMSRTECARCIVR